MITYLKGNLTFLNGTRLLLDVFLKTKLMIKDEIFMTKSDRIIREVHWACCRSLFWIENEMKQNEVLHENFIYFFSYLPYQFYSWSFDILWKICRIYSWYKGYTGPPLELISCFDREGPRTPIPPHLVSLIKTTQSCSWRLTSGGRSRGWRTYS